MDALWAGSGLHHASMSLIQQKQNLNFDLFVFAKGSCCLSPLCRKSSKWKWHVMSV